MYTLLVTYAGFDFEIDKRLSDIVGRAPDKSVYRVWRGGREVMWNFASRTHAEMARERLISVISVVKGRSKKMDIQIKRAWRTMDVMLLVNEDEDEMQFTEAS